MELSQAVLALRFAGSFATWWCPRQTWYIIDCNGIGSTESQKGDISRVSHIRIDSGIVLSACSLNGDEVDGFTINA